MVIAVVAAEAAYYRLVLLVGPPGAGKTATMAGIAGEQGWPVIRLSGILAESLLDVPVRRRAVAVPRLIDDVLQRAVGPVVCLDNIELLFEPSLQQNPLRLLQNLARDRTIVAAWPGAHAGDTLSYGGDDHPETRRYTRPEAVIVPLVVAT